MERLLAGLTAIALAESRPCTEITSTRITFTGGRCVDRECVNRARKFLRQGRIDHSMAFDPVFAGEGL